MSLFGLFKVADINKGVEEYKSHTGAVLLDVRTEQEYCEGYIPDSVNVPLQSIKSINLLIVNKETFIYVYCRSGSRSEQAVNILHEMGYQNVKNIGGISDYKGKLG